MKKILFFNIVFLASTCLGQQTSSQFNHAYLVLDSADYTALISSDFIKNEFAGFFTRSTSTNSVSWTGAYFYGDINYLEIFAPSASEHPVGSSAMSLGTDRVGDLLKMKAILAKDYTIQLEHSQRKVNDSLISWFEALYIKDSTFFKASSILFWIMEYEKDYFLFNKLDFREDSVSRKTYLAQHEEKRRNKYLQRFTGLEFQATKSEIHYYCSLLLKCGFRKIKKNTFLSTEGFKMSFLPRQKDAKYSINSLQFVTTKPSFQTVKISNRLKVILNGDTGNFQFN